MSELTSSDTTTESSNAIEVDDGDQPCQGLNRLPMTDFPDLSMCYLIQVWIGLIFLTADIGTDIIFAIYNIITGITPGMHGRIIQGVLSLLIVIFPCFQYLTSNNYKYLKQQENLVPAEENLVPAEENLVPEKENLVPAEENLVPEKENLVPEKENLVPAEENLVPEKENLVPAEENLSILYGKTGLKIKIFDTLIWQYNHARHTMNYMVRMECMVPGRKYDNENMNETISVYSARRDFYISKRMAQLGVKIEAQLEATYQIGLAALVYFHYYDEYSLRDKIFMVVSLAFSVISIARAATSDLMKTGVKSKKSIEQFNSIQLEKFKGRKDYEGYPEQNAIWKICRFLSVLCQIVATLVNVPCNYWISLWLLGDFALFELRTFGIIVAVSLMNLSFNTAFQLMWATLNDFTFLHRDPERSKCQIVQRWFHFFVRSPFINAFRSPSLYNYSLSYWRVLGLLALNSVSLLILSLPNIYFGTHHPVYVVFNYVFIVSILFNIVFSVIVKVWTKPIQEESMLRDLAKASRLP